MKYLQERIAYLEKINRLTLDALDLAATLGRFEVPINKFESPAAILSDIDKRVRTLLSFQAVAFYLVDEGDSSFKSALCTPESSSAYMDREMEGLIQSRTLAWTLDQHRPVVVSDTSREKRLLIHAIQTATRTRGVFVGVLEASEREIPDITLAVFSILINGSAYVLESYELYKWTRDTNSELKDKVEQLVSSKEKLRRSDLMLKDAQSITRTGCWEYDVQKDESYWSDELYNLFGYTPGEIAPTYEKLFSHIHPGDQKSLSQSIEGFSFANRIVDTEYRIVTRDGQEKHVSARTKFEHDASRKLVLLRGTIQDVTTRKRAAAESEKLQLQLQRAEKMETVGMLAGGVAHDLNNILGAIVGYPELLLGNLDDDSPLRGPLVAIKKSGERAASIVSDLLSLARRGVSASEVMNINDVVTEYISSYQCKKLKEFHPNVSITSHLAPNLPHILGSPVHLFKVVMNLLSNAAEAMSNGGRVMITTKEMILSAPMSSYENIAEGRYSVMVVSDTGIGISPEDLKKIFEPFYTKKVMGRSGTGLGMAVVWGTVKDHKGYIDVKSRPGEGTTFSLFFPVTGKKAPAQKKSAMIQAYSGNGESILVVDDNREQRELALCFLKKLNYTVEAVSSGEQAVEYVRQHPVAIIIIDMIMDPGMDGLETYKEILKINPEQKAVVVSGFSETERVREVQQLGAGAYITKPYTQEKIGTVLKSELRKKAATHHK